jgi:hypothetical protein
MTTKMFQHGVAIRSIDSYVPVIAAMAQFAMN